MSFQIQSAYVGPFSVSVGRGRTGEIQRFRYPVPVRQLEQHFAPRMFILSGRMHLRWSSGPEFDRELGPGGSFTEDAADNRPLMLDEELTVQLQEDGSYVCVAPIGVEQKLAMRRVQLQPGECLEVPRYDLAVTADSAHAVIANGRSMPAGPRLYYGRHHDFELSADGPVECAVFSMLG